MMFALIVAGLLFLEEPIPKVSILTQIGIVMSLSFFVFFGLFIIKQGLFRQKLLSKHQSSSNEQIIQRNSEVRAELDRRYSSNSKMEIKGKLPLVIGFMFILGILSYFSFGLNDESQVQLSDVAGIILAIILYMFLYILNMISENSRMRVVREWILLSCIMKIREIEIEE
jgi:hypothetical protein